MVETFGKDPTCSVARSIQVLGDSWTLLIVRDAMIAGVSRFQDFRKSLGIAPNILSKRLASLVDEGVFERRTYQEPGARPRDEYVLTDAGRSLALVIGALGAWGRAYRPRPDGTSPEFTLGQSGDPAHLAFVTTDGREIAPDELLVRRTRDF